jgi:hypothetical protein
MRTELELAYFWTLGKAKLTFKWRHCNFLSQIHTEAIFKPIASKTLCFEWSTVLKYSETQFGWACIVAYNTLPSKKISGRKYAKNIFRTGGSVGIDMLELIIDEYLSFILRTAQHWLELNRSFQTST